MLNTIVFVPTPYIKALICELWLNAYNFNRHRNAYKTNMLRFSCYLAL